MKIKANHLIPHHISLLTNNSQNSKKCINYNYINKTRQVNSIDMQMIHIS
jgi:hypothetical protein